MTDFVFTLSSGVTVPVVITTRRGIKNITLRPKFKPEYEIHISKPWLVSASAAIRFLESKQRWIERVFQQCPQKVKLNSGEKIEFLGRDVLLIHDPSARSNRFDLDNSVLYVGGGADMFEHRVRNFIKSEFLVELKKMICAVPNEFHPKRIAVRDTSSRWGSCSSTGTMSFSWRLAFAPLDVMRYVVMHELAHTRHMNHSDEFWMTVRELYGPGVERAKRWLSVHGADLHRFF